MVWTAQDWGVIIGPLTALFGTLGALLYTYYRTKIRGPEFKLLDIFIDSITEIKAGQSSDNPEKYIVLSILLKAFNIGDKKGYMKINDVSLNLDNSYDCKREKKDNKRENKIWEIALDSDTFRLKRFNFIIPLKLRNWKKGSLALKGYYFDKKGNPHQYKALFEGPNKEKEVWKPLTP